MAVAPCEEGELDRGGRLAGSLEADQHQERRRLRRIPQPFRVASEQLDELVVDRLDHGLRRGEPWRDLRSYKPHAHAIDELLDDLEIHVCLEEREAHLAQSCVDVFGTQHTTTGDLLEGGGE